MQARVKDIVKIMEEHFPAHLAESWDNVGLQIGSYDSPVQTVVVSLDIDEEILEHAFHHQAQMIITHHPLFFKAVKHINTNEAQGKLINKIIKENICVYSAHTNLDAGEKGLNQILAERIGLKEIQTLDRSYVEPLYKLVVYVPVGHEDLVRQAITDAGAGSVGRYSDCSFRSRGTGTFKPAEGTAPFIGTPGKLEEVDEYRLETIIPKPLLNRVLNSMHKAHPYEEVAYDLYLLENEGRIFSLGRTGKLDKEQTLGELCTKVKGCLGLQHLRVVGDLNQQVRKAAVVSGAGASFMSKARAKNCDVLITGDLKYHEARDAEELGICIIDAGHQGTEQIVTSYLIELLKDNCSARNLNVKIVPVTGHECIRTV